MADQPIEGAVQQQEPKEIVIETATGAVFKGATPEEVMEKMKSSIESGSQTIKQYKEMNEQLTSSIGALQKPRPAASESGFDKAKYYELLNDDPVAAQDYIDATRYGRPFSEVKESFERSARVTGEVAQLMEINKFQQTLARLGEEYQGTPENGDALLNKLGQRPLTAENLTSAYVELKAEGKIKAPAKAAEPTQQRKPPASPRGGGSAELYNGKRPEEMSIDELKRAMANATA